MSTYLPQRYCLLPCTLCDSQFCCAVKDHYGLVHFCENCDAQRNFILSYELEALELQRYQALIIEEAEYLANLQDSIENERYRSQQETQCVSLTEWDHTDHFVFSVSDQTQISWPPPVLRTVTAHNAFVAQAVFDPRTNARRPTPTPLSPQQAWRVEAIASMLINNPQRCLGEPTLYVKTMDVRDGDHDYKYSYVAVRFGRAHDILIESHITLCQSRGHSPQIKPRFITSMERDLNNVICELPLHISHYRHLQTNGQLQRMLLFVEPTSALYQALCKQRNALAAHARLTSVTRQSDIHLSIEWVYERMPFEPYPHDPHENDHPQFSEEVVDFGILH